MQLMIASLEGILSSKKEKFVVLDIAGTGYKIFVSNETNLTLPQEGGKVKLHTFLYVREDALELYGFATENEQMLFELLNTVSGIGPRAAMNILGASSPQKLQEAIAHGDEGILTAVSGIGKKLAARVIAELKDKIREVIHYEGGTKNIGDSEVFDALRKFGYGERQIQEVLRKLPADLTKIEERIRSALKMLGK
ncbi:MAG: Holliday junction branch migration protein RuvA [bacterium]|nr:Holliday junction branch migration protein RuvA [bacterium]